MGATAGAPARDEALLKFLALRGKYRRAALLLAEARRVERGYPPGPPEAVAASELEASRRWRPAAASSTLLPSGRCVYDHVQLLREA